MPILELKSLDKLPRKKPFKFLSGVFRRGASDELEVTEDMLYGCDHSPDRSGDRAGTPAGHLDIEDEMETLHLSRRDNPYLSSCEALDDVGCDHASLSPSLGSPRQASMSPPDSGVDPMSPPSYSNILTLHSHLIRSPPPVHWPANEEDGRALSPESGVGSDNDTSGVVTRHTDMVASVTRHRSQSVERMLSSDHLSPVRGQTPAVSPARGHTPDTLLYQPPTTPTTTDTVTPYTRTYSRSISQSSSRLRSKTPDEDFSPTRFNIYTLHQRQSGLSRSCKSKSSYLVTSPGKDCVYSYQPASRRSLAQLASNSKYGATRKSSMDTFTSWLPKRKRTRSQTRPDAKSMENLQSPTRTYGSIRGCKEKASYTHKSMSCMREDVGLISNEHSSPCHTRKSLSNIKKSFSLKQKPKPHYGPVYRDVDTGRYKDDHIL